MIPPNCRGVSQRGKPGNHATPLVNTLPLISKDPQLQKVGGEDALSEHFPKRTSDLGKISNLRTSPNLLHSK